MAPLPQAHVCEYEDCTIIYRSCRGAASKLTVAAARGKEVLTVKIENKHIFLAVVIGLLTCTSHGVPFDMYARGGNCGKALD